MTDTGTRATVDGDDEQTDGGPGDVDGTTETTGNAAVDDGPGDVDTSHLDDVDDGCGCAEVWEHLSEERDE